MKLMTQLTDISIWLLNAREWEAQALSSQTEILWWYVPSFVLLLFTKMIVFILLLSMKLSYLILCWSGIAKDEPKPVMPISFPNWLDYRFRFVWLNQFFVMTGLKLFQHIDIRPKVTRGIYQLENKINNYQKYMRCPVCFCDVRFSWWWTDIGCFTQIHGVGYDF